MRTNMVEYKNHLLCSFISDQDELERRLRRHSCYLCESKGQPDDGNHRTHNSWQSGHPNLLARCSILAVMSVFYSLSYIKFAQAQEKSCKNTDKISAMILVSDLVPSLVMCSLFGVTLVLFFNFIYAKPGSNTLSREWIQDENELEELRKKLCWDIPEHMVMERREKYASILSKALQIPTISYDNFDLNSEISNQSSKNDTDQFITMHKLLVDSFPTLHKKFPPKIINNYSLLYHIPGSDKSLDPIMLCAHLDVVPAPSEGSQKWLQDPFSGKVIDGVIWGRGAIDNKQNVVGQLGAIENILINNIDLKRGLYIALGHDEEIGGHEGAAYIAKYLNERNIRFEGIYDEGSMLVSGAIPGLKGHLGLIGCDEKGMITVELKVNGIGGHSSMPPLREENIISIIGKAVSKLEANPFPSHFKKDTPMRTLLERVAWRMSPSMRFICSNFWLFGPFMKRILTNISNGAAASVRTTTAVTMIRGGTKFNVLPYSVSAYVNHRIHPSDTISDVLTRDRKIINDERVQLRVLDFSIPSFPRSRTDIDAYHRIQRCIQVVFGHPAAPTLLTGNTDTRHYHDLSDNVYRFSPVELHISDLGMFHGLNERLSVDGICKVVQYFEAFIMLSCCA